MAEDTTADATRRLNVKKQTLDDAYAAPANFLEIDVVNPVTMGVGKKRYTDYEVRMRVSRAGWSRYHKGVIGLNGNATSMFTSLSAKFCGRIVCAKSRADCRTHVDCLIIARKYGFLLPDQPASVQSEGIKRQTAVQ